MMKNLTFRSTLDYEQKSFFWPTLDFEKNPTLWKNPNFGQPYIENNPLLANPRFEKSDFWPALDY